MKALRELQVLLFCQQKAVVYDSTRSLSKIGKSVDSGLLLRIQMKEIQLSQGKVALVDDEDYEWLNQWKWYTDSSGYAVHTFGKRPNRKNIRMQRLLIKIPKGKMIDHKDGNPINNQKINLRVCNALQNAQNAKVRNDNSSGYKGVRIHGGKKWQASIKYIGKEIYLGLFDTPMEAAQIYNAAAIKYHGEFAYLNIIKQDEMVL